MLLFKEALLVEPEQWKVDRPRLPAERTVLPAPEICAGLDEPVAGSYDASPKRTVKETRPGPVGGFGGAERE